MSGSGYCWKPETIRFFFLLSWNLCKWLCWLWCHLQTDESRAVLWYTVMCDQGVLALAWVPRMSGGSANLHHQWSACQQVQVSVAHGAHMVPRNEESYWMLCCNEQYSHSMLYVTGQMRAQGDGIFSWSICSMQTVHCQNKCILYFTQTLKTGASKDNGITTRTSDGWSAHAFRSWPAGAWKGMKGYHIGPHHPTTTGHAYPAQFALTSPHTPIHPFKDEPITL